MKNRRITPNPKARSYLASTDMAKNVRDRWNEGRAEYGPHWQGDFPLVEAYMEVLDLENYLMEAEADGSINNGQAEGLLTYLRALHTAIWDLANVDLASAGGHFGESIQLDLPLGPSGPSDDPES